MSETQNGIFSRPLPEGYREELGALIAEKAETPVRELGSMLLFQLGGLTMALPTTVATAVAPILHIARIPHRSGTVLLGVTAFRGDLLPCVSLARLLELEHVQAGTGRTLILEESPGRRWAVPIDGVLGIRLVGQSERIAKEDAGGKLGAHWIRESFRDGAEVFPLLDSDVLFRQITLATA